MTPQEIRDTIPCTCNLDPYQCRQGRALADAILERKKLGE